MHSLFNPLHVQNVKENVGKLVKSARSQRKITQEELAQRLSLSRITVQNLESGKNTTIETLLLALKEFDLLESFNEFIETQIEDNNQKSLY